MIGAYIRVSTARQGDGESPENQRERLRDAGATEFYVDTVSGYRIANRRKAAEFQRLKADIEAGRLTRLLTTRLDRIARRDAIVIELSELCDRNNVEFLRLNAGRVDTSTTSGWLSVKLELLMAEHFSRQLSENIRNGLAAQVARGVSTRPATSLPFHLAPDPDLRRGVVPSVAWDDARHAVEQVMAGAWTLSDGARFIHARHGIMPRSSAFSKWIKGQALLGHQATREGVVKIAACWPALITPAERDQILEVVSANRSRWGRNALSNGPPRALSGICRCHHCGGRLHYSGKRSKGKSYEYLCCDNRAECPAACRYVPALMIEQLLLIQHVIPRIEALIAQKQSETQAPSKPSPQVTEWRRELRFRQRTPQEFLLPAERERINELQLLIARANEPAIATSTPDLAPLALRLANATLDPVCSWFSDPPSVRNENLKALLASVTVDALKRQIRCAMFCAGGP